jgi:hypothetical protein
MTTNQPTRSARDAAEVAQRVRRVALIAVLASFVSLFGLAVASTPPSQASANAAANSDVRVVCTGGSCSTVKVHVRTRTS